MTTSVKPLIRIAKIEDAPEIANVHVHSWRETYTGLMPAFKRMHGLPKKTWF